MINFLKKNCRKKEEAAEQKRCEEESARLHQAEMGEQLPPEPPAGKNVSTLRFRFPDGSTKSRRFLQDARLSVLFIYIGSEGFAEVSKVKTSNKGLVKLLRS